MPKKTEQPTRPDLKDDLQWLVWLGAQEENKGIDVTGLYRDMMDWCAKKRKTPNRLRLLNWLRREREAQPMTALPTRDLLNTGRNAGILPATGEASDAAPRCSTCNDTREIPHKPQNAQYDWELEFIPCPDCSVISVPSVAKK